MAELEVKFNRGLNSAIDAFTDAPGYATSFSDYRLDYGILRPRNAMGTCLASAIGANDKIDGVFMWTAPGQAGYTQGGSLYINDQTSGKFYRTGQFSPGNEGIMTVIDITNAVAQNVNPMSFASLNGILVYTGVNGHVNQITSGSALCASLTTPAKFGVVRTVNNIMFGSSTIVGGDTSSTFSTIYWSAVGDPTTWPASSNLTFRNNDGDVILGLGELNSQVLIFKQLSIGLLQTTSQTVSGTVTLGPLTTIFQGIGLLSPQCVDNLPDGRCVFWGYDYNVYITDGSTLTNLSNNAPPGLNVIGALIAQAPVKVPAYLRYWPLRNEIILGGVINSNNVLYAYDIQQQYWRQITGVSPWSMCVAKNTDFGINGLFPTASSSLLIGNASGQVIDIDRNDNTSPTDQTGASVTPNMTASVVIPTNFFNSDLVCLTILYSSTSTIAWSYAFDNGGFTSQVALPTGRNRADLKINLKSNSSSGQRPSTFQIKFSDVNSGKIYRIVLSDEVTA